MKRKSSTFLLTLFLSAGFLLTGFFLSGVARADASWTNTGGGLGTYVINDFAYDSTHNVLYTGTSGYGVWKYDGTTWTDTGGSVSSCSIGSLAYDSAHNVLYAATSYAGVEHGVWSCTNPNTSPSWTDTGGGLSSNHVSIDSLAYDSTHNVLYAGGHSPSAGGKSAVWSCTSPNTSPSWTSAGGPGVKYIVYSLAYDSTHNVLYAGTHGYGVWSCTNPNTSPSWKNIWGGLSTCIVFSLEYDSTHNVLYAGGLHPGTGHGSGVWSCTNPNTSPSWTDTGGGLSSYIILSLAYDSTHNVLYAGTENPSGANGYGVWSCTNPNASPSWMNTGGGVSSYIICSLAYDSTHNVLYAGTNGKGVWYCYGYIPCNPTYYLAEGTSDYGFDTYVTIENPNKSAVTAKVTYMTKSGPKTRAALTLPPMSQTVINPRNDIGATDFSTKVVCQEGKTICVDRRMIWNGPGAPSQEGHSSVGVTSPAKTWYLAEGSSKWGFESWLLIQNPNATDASITITYMVEGKGPVSAKKTVKANSRASFNMETDIGQADASIKVDSNVPVIPERAMYRNNRREGHCSIGTTTPAKDYYLAEGTTGWGFTTFVLVQNPNPKATTVNITYMTPTGPVPQAAFTMEANSRKTITVNSVPSMSKTDCSIHVTGSLPLIAERSMYWGAGTPLGEACHDSIGMDAPHTTFYLPDGETTSGCETWTLVQNPNSASV
jgi:hypothetical protein